MRIPIIIICRMGSTRLPGKTLKPFGDGNLLSYQIHRIKKYVPNADIIVSTSTCKQDQAIINFCKAMGVPATKGNPTNVCARVLATMESFKLENAIVVLGDNPWLEARLAPGLFSELINAPNRLWVTPTPEIGDEPTDLMLPIGTRLQGVNFQFLKYAVDKLPDDQAGEHLAVVLKKHSPNQAIGILRIDNGFSYKVAKKYNISINTLLDYQLATNVLERIESDDIHEIYSQYLRVV